MRQIEMFYFLAAERRFREREQLAVMTSERLAEYLTPLIMLMLKAR